MVRRSREFKETMVEEEVIVVAPREVAPSIFIGRLGLKASGRWSRIGNSRDNGMGRAMVVLPGSHKGLLAVTLAAGSIFSGSNSRRPGWISSLGSRTWRRTAGDNRLGRRSPLQTRLPIRDLC